MGLKNPGVAARVFKTKHFAKTAKAAGIDDAELCEAVSELEKSQGDDLGAGVWKKRLGLNRYRSILISKTSSYWIFVYLFAKKDRENIDSGRAGGIQEIVEGLCDGAIGLMEGNARKRGFEGDLP